MISVAHLRPSLNIPQRFINNQNPRTITIEGHVQISDDECKKDKHEQYFHKGEPLLRTYLFCSKTNVTGLSNNPDISFDLNNVAKYTILSCSAFVNFSDKSALWTSEQPDYMGGFRTPYLTREVSGVIEDAKSVQFKCYIVPKPTSNIPKKGSALPNKEVDMVLSPEYFEGLETIRNFL
ncbi:MAG: hypothetical protein QNJ31_04785 [Candidatus Caenarcaniphilales bacterium]|nr:hypothetical protein [Candidatus Caenarcaniphilales bacterium]